MCNFVYCDSSFMSLSLTRPLRIFVYCLMLTVLTYEYIIYIYTGCPSTKNGRLTCLVMDMYLRDHS